jgi:transcriptional regulator with XRE-family HTH domain
MEDLKPVIAQNIIELRKSMNWTKAALAQKLNYSDKAVSKWERGESIPDISVLKAITELFHVTMDYLLEPEHPKDRPVPSIVLKYRNRNRLIVTLQSAALVFLVATLVYVFLELFSVPIYVPTWMFYIYAIPVTCIVLLVFNSLWGKGKVNYAIISLLLWSTLLSICLSLQVPNIWLIFIIGIPGQIIILLWANFKRKT